MGILGKPPGIGLSPKAPGADGGDAAPRREGAMRVKNASGEQQSRGTLEPFGHERSDAARDEGREWSVELDRGERKRFCGDSGTYTAGSAHAALLRIAGFSPVASRTHAYPTRGHGFRRRGANGLRCRLIPYGARARTPPSKASGAAPCRKPSWSRPSTPCNGRATANSRRTRAADHATSESVDDPPQSRHELSPVP
jgi:hypothetical protein